MLRLTANLVSIQVLRLGLVPPAARRPLQPVAALFSTISTWVAMQPKAIAPLRSKHPDGMAWVQLRVMDGWVPRVSAETMGDPWEAPRGKPIVI